MGRVCMNRVASETDLPFINSLSPELFDHILQRKVKDGRLRIIEARKRPIGILKFCVLWETLPLIEAILLQESMRHRGYGTEAVRAWEHEMTQLGFDVALISTLANETAQRFWRKLGYVDCGSFKVSSKPAEFFMQHALK